jgi:hypothetical protein
MKSPLMGKHHESDETTAGEGDSQSSLKLGVNGI